MVVVGVATGQSERTRLVILGATLAAVALVLPTLATLGVFDTDAPAPPETVLRMGFLNKVDSLNPLLGSTDASRFFYGLVYDSLQAHDEDLNIAPNLALNWRMVPATDPQLAASGEPSGSVWEYNLTANAKWHDGQPFTADDVVWNLNLNCLGDDLDYMWTYSPYTYFMKYAEKVDNDTVRVHFYDRENGTSIPVAFGEFLPIYMLPRHLMDGMQPSYISFQWPGHFSDAGPGTLPIVGTGPYKVSPEVWDEFVAGERLTLYRNEDYHWLADKAMEVLVDRIVMYFYDDSTAMKIALQSHELDIGLYPSSPFRAIESQIASGTLRQVETFSGLKADQETLCIRINTNPGGYTQAKWRCDTEARRALAQAINRTHIVDAIYNGTAQEGAGPFSPIHSAWYWTPGDQEDLDCDQVAARERLENAGYVDTDADGVRECTAGSEAVSKGWATEGTELTIEAEVWAEYPEHKEVAEYLESQWAQIGVDLGLSLISYSIWPSPNPISFAPQMRIMSTRSDYDPCFALYEHSSRAGYWSFDGSYANTSYDENFTSSIMELDPNTRKQYVSDCLAVTYQDVPCISLAHLYSNYAWRTDTFSGWGNWSEHPGLRIGSLGGANALLFNLEARWYTGTEGKPGWAYALGIASAGAATVVLVQLVRTRGAN